jgi:tetratricopeptide (TPR) repeat protein
VLAINLVSDHVTLRDQFFTHLTNAAPKGRPAERKRDRAVPVARSRPEATKQISEIFTARRACDLEKALRLATELTERLPDYAEGWNQKVTVLFMQDKPDASLEAIARVLELEPKHFGALAGKAVILIRRAACQSRRRACARRSRSTRFSRSAI